MHVNCLPSAGDSRDLKSPTGSLKPTIDTGNGLQKIKAVMASSYHMPDLPRTKARDDGGVVNWRMKKPMWIFWVMCANNYDQCGKKYSSARCRMRRVNKIITHGVVHKR
jgi:hypothetical protein